MKTNRLAIYVLAIGASLGILSAQTVWAKAEPWYFNMGIGWGSPSYPSQLQSALSGLKAAGVSNVPIAIDLGFYWPIKTASVLGVCINGLSDSYTQNTTEMSVVQTGIFASGMQFFGKEPGDGFFVRGDLGGGRAAVTLNSSLAATSEYGLGVGAGIGYGFPVSDETRLLLQGNYMYRRIEGNDYGSLGITLNGFF